jgi:pyruvate formate lyase activating enzyme
LTSGTIFDIKRFAIHDGPGVRTTVFFKGCPLGCLVCHNPEGQSRDEDVLVRPDRCTLCGDCLEICKLHAISPNSDAVRIDRTVCDLCGACAEECLPGAIELAGREVTVEEVIEEIERDTVYYDESGGGVTFSGGEPLFQPEFLTALLSECRRREITTVVDTSGYGPAETVATISGMVDLFLYDLKLMDGERHQAFTGVDNGPILENLRWLAGEGAPVTIRIPLLPAVNDDEPNIHAMGSFVASLPIEYPIDILPYHRIGIDKYTRLGRTYRLPEVEAPTEQEIAAVVDSFESFGLNVTVKGEAYVTER